EAGGHVWGETSLLPLLDAVLDAVDVPVLAAGAITSPRALAAVLAAGADGARMGTRFVATKESGAHPSYVAAVVSASGEETEITGHFNVCPLCALRPRARVLRSAIDALDALDDDNVGTFHGNPVPRAAGMPPSRDMEGAIEAMAMYCGEGAGAVNDAVGAAEVVTGFTRDAEALLRRAVG